MPEITYGRWSPTEVMERVLDGTWVAATPPSFYLEYLVIAGGGGGGRFGGSQTGAAGGSGIVVFRFPSIYTATFSGGVTQTSDTTTIPGTTIVTVTATSTTSETVTFS